MYYKHNFESVNYKWVNCFSFFRNLMANGLYIRNDYYNLRFNNNALVD